MPDLASQSRYSALGVDTVTILVAMPKDKSKRKGWKEFELAVHAFAKASNPGAKVLFNHHVPDRETRRRRQCDVWIETVVGVWPFTIYVSCKDYFRKLDASHIDNFIREKEARGATSGLIYCKKGFTAGAIEKAKFNGVVCCQLFVNQPVDLPKILPIVFFTCRTRVGFRLLPKPDPDLTWGELFGRPMGESSFIEHLDKVFRDNEAASASSTTASRGIPQDFVADVEIPGTDGHSKLQLVGQWCFFKSRTDAQLVSGSYCVNDGGFFGDVASPSIDRQEFNPGQGWDPVDRTFPFPDPLIMLVLYGGSWKEEAEKRRHQKICDPAS